MKTYDVEHASIFPAYWRVNEMLANSFCEGTREDFKSILQKAVRRGDGQSLDVELLLSCLQETLDFEHSLERRFSNEVREDGLSHWNTYSFLRSHVLLWTQSLLRTTVHMALVRPSLRLLNPT